MMNRHVADVIGQHRVVAMPPQATVRDAARRMKAEHVASVVVTDPDRHAAGIFTERDLTDRVVAEGLDPDATPLAIVMTPCPVTTGPEATVAEALRSMGVNSLRHLPVVAEGRVIGLVSMRDFVGDELALFDREAERMQKLAEIL